MTQQLQEQHLQEWLDSKVASEIVEKNVVSLSGTSGYEYLLYALSNLERRNDGRLKDRWLTRYKHIEQGGWWCGSTDILTGERSEWGCLKPDTPRIDSHNRKTIKYEHPPQTPTGIFALEPGDRIWGEIADRFSLEKTGHSFWTWAQLKSRLPILITEGAKKAGALLSAGYCAIALPGINSGYRSENEKELIPELKALAKGKREIVLVFDSDRHYKTRERIVAATSQTGKLLEECDCKVSVLVWDNKLGKGVDDFIANQGIERFEALFESRMSLREYEESKKKRTIYLDSANLLEFMQAEFDTRLSFDDLRSEILLDGEPIQLSNELKFWFIDRYGYRCGSNDLLDCTAYLAKQNSFNPVKAYLAKCYQNNSRISIDNLASRYLGTDDPLYDEMLKRWLIGAVARAFDPGCQLDYALLLQGKQGVGKSTFFKTLGGKWFDDSVKDITSDDAFLMLDRCWIQELAEFERITKKKEIEDVKVFVTRVNDIFRRKYDREASEHPRRSAICGSVNKLSFLLDETGHRRFWVIPVNPSLKKIHLAQLKADRDLIWGSAVAAYKAGELPKLSDEFEERSALNNKRFEVEDTWECEIDAFIANLEITSVSEILSKALNIEVARHDKPFQMRVTQILTKLGWQKSKKVMFQDRPQIVWRNCGVNTQNQYIEKGVPILEDNAEKEDGESDTAIGTPLEGVPIDHAEKSAHPQKGVPIAETYAQKEIEPTTKRIGTPFSIFSNRALTPQNQNEDISDLSWKVYKPIKEPYQRPSSPFQQGEWVTIVYIDGHEGERYRVKTCSHTHVSLEGFQEGKGIFVWMVESDENRSAS